MIWPVGYSLRDLSALKTFRSYLSGRRSQRFLLVHRHAAVQLVEALHYKPEGRGFDSQRYQWNFSSFRPHYGPEIDSASNRNEYQEYFLGGKGGRWVGLTTLPLSYAHCLEIWDPHLYI